MKQPPIYIYMHIVDLNEYLDSLTYQTFRIDASNSFHWLTEGPYFRISIVPNSLSNNHLHKNKCKIIQNFYWCSSFQILKTSIIYIKVSILVWRHPHQASSSLSSSSSCFTFFHRRPKKQKSPKKGRVERWTSVFCSYFRVDTTNAMFQY